MFLSANCVSKRCGGYDTFMGRIALLLVLFVLLMPFYVSAQNGNDTTAVAADHPDIQPYETSYSMAHHVLAFPSYLLHWASRPVGWGIKYAEENFPHWFEGERGSYGFVPLIEVGGEQGFAGGALLYHDHLFYPDHRARAQILFGSQEYNEFDIRYHVPVKGLEDATLSFYGEYENYPERSYYLNGDELLFASEYTNVEVRYDQQLNPKIENMFLVRYRDMTIKSSSFIDDENELVPQSMQGNEKLFAIGSRWTFNHKNGRKRATSGTQYVIGGNWSQSVETHSLSYLEYYGEIHHFVPIPILPKTRRLGLKAQLRRQENLASESIPFYELPALGGTRNSRGYPSNRFRAQGTLQLTAEYRYPVWDFLDMAIFVDEGQPFDNYNDLALGDFKTSYGFGFHLLSSNGLAFRSEFAFSTEGSRLIISIGPNF